MLLRKAPFFQLVLDIFGEPSSLLCLRDICFVYFYETSFNGLLVHILPLVCSFHSLFFSLRMYVLMWKYNVQWIFTPPQTRAPRLDQTFHENQDAFQSKRPLTNVPSVWVQDESSNIYEPSPELSVLWQRRFFVKISLRQDTSSCSFTELINHTLLQLLLSPK